MRTAALLLAVLTVSRFAVAETTCQTPPGLGSAGAWRQGANIHVNIDPGLPSWDRKAIERAFNNWREAIGDGIVQFYFTSTRPPIVGEDADTGEFDAIQVTRAFRNNGSAASTMVASDGVDVVRAYMSYDPGVTNMDALTRFIAHEIGHTFGLADCGYCAPLSSVMIKESGGLNDTSRVPTAPTACDVDKMIENKNYRRNGGGGGHPTDKCPDCTKQVCIDEPEYGLRCELRRGYCCPFGFIDLADAMSVGTCPFLNWYSPGDADVCAAECDEDCVRQQHCGDLQCQPYPNYCWKCPSGAGPTPGNPPPGGPVGLTCAEMGWFSSNQGAECEAACGEPCREKQWCGEGWCQPYPHYCWKCPGM